MRPPASGHNAFVCPAGPSSRKSPYDDVVILTAARGLMSVGRKIRPRSNTRPVPWRCASSGRDPAKAAGQDLTLADIAGANTQAQAGNVARLPGPAREPARQFLETRQIGSDTAPSQG